MATMLMAPANRANTKWAVGPGGRYCSCCDVSPRHNKNTRRSVKRAQRQTFRIQLARRGYA